MYEYLTFEQEDYTWFQVIQTIDLAGVYETRYILCKGLPLGEDELKGLVCQYENNIATLEITHDYPIKDMDLYPERFEMGKVYITQKDTDGEMCIEEYYQGDIAKFALDKLFGDVAMDNLYSSGDIFDWGYEEYELTEEEIELMYAELPVE